MKKLLTLVLCWLIAFSAMAENTFKAKTAASVAGGYLTSLNKVDGSFEDVVTQWVASVGTITPTASTEFQGEKKGVWAGTGAGTLDLQWTATASNTYEASAQVNVQGEDDVYVCAYVGTTETGCKLIPALSKIQKVSVVADSVISSAFYLRLKHTGSDAFSIDTDDGKIEPWTPQAVNLTTLSQVALSFNVANYAVSSSGNYIYATAYTSSSIYGADLSYTSDSTNGLRFIAKKTGILRVTSNIGKSNSANLWRPYKNGVAIPEWSGSPFLYGNTNIGIAGGFEIPVGSGDIVTIQGTSSGEADMLSNKAIVATLTAISDNVVQSYQPSDSLGELRFLPQNIAPKGFIPALGSSIGKAAGTYQGDTYYDLYKVLWTQSSVTAGEPYVISSAKGTDAATDWAANKTITIDVSGLVVRAYKSGTTGAVGAKQLDAFQAHGHGYNSIVLGSSIGSGGAYNTGVQSTSTYTVDGTNGTPRTASETRMTNIAQYAFIRYGNDAPTLLALPASKENVFSAVIGNNGTASITSKDADWISSVTRTSLGYVTLVSKNLGLTAVPEINITGIHSEYSATNIISASVSGGALTLTYKTGINGIGTYDIPVNVAIKKQSPDYTAPGVFISNLNPDGFNRTLGATGLIDNFSFSYGTTNATTVCSASPCSYLDQIGNYVTSVTRGASGNYTANFSKTFSKLNCLTYASPSGTTTWASSRTSCLNCSSVTLITYNSGGTQTDSYGTLMCQGY